MPRLSRVGNQTRPNAFLPESRARADAGPGQFRLWPSDGSVGTQNRASVFGPILGRHSCRVSDESATEPAPARCVFSGGPMLALVIFNYGPVTAVSAPVIGPVYSARFWGVIHAETQPSRQPGPA
ncbi:hypothetical protein VZT92_026526 [Zoarces viviparus]|uniref:Uncharacterized protein n=1 Tax=Zoarces viviparus TaxID=48416 RepID=A0AAW1DZX6_ZOAVI